MAKRKMIQANLLKNSISAYFAAVEIHNKPSIRYRYETVTLLMLNAWELALKSYIRKYIRSKSIFTADGHTIGFRLALSYVTEHINSAKPKSFESIKSNLLALEEYRNNVVHFYNDNMDAYAFMLIAKSAINYVDFIKKYFNKDILATEGLYILPLGFKLPFKPDEFLTKKAASSVSSKEARRFIEMMVNVTTELQKDGVDDSIVLGFDVYLENVKRITNSDLLVAITSRDNADASFTKRTQVVLSNDPNAKSISVTEDELLRLFPYSYKDVYNECKASIKGFKQDKKFNSIMRNLKEDKKYCYVRMLHPHSKNSQKTFLYSESIIDEIKSRYLQ